MASTALQEFLKKESAAGLILMCATVLALVVANSPLDVLYQQLTYMPVAVKVGEFSIDKPLILWINDGLMAVFFFLVGLELKREICEGELSNPSNVILPVAGAIGGMLLPAAIYAYFNWHDPTSLDGWAIPAATDIAFALGVLALLGSRVPVSLKIFLVTLAIIDDIGAILIIAMFYTNNISMASMIVAAICVLLLWDMNRRHVSSLPSYILVGLVLWVAVLKSGVHATLAGVVLALFIPMTSKDDPQHSPVKELEHDLHPAVSFAILPLFAFANAGLPLAGITLDSILHPVSLGVFLGLVVGKQVGVFGFCWLAVKTGLAKLPDDLNLKAIYGCSLLCGIGFTMSLFIGSLAFEETLVDKLFDERLGILCGSLISGIAGYIFLKLAIKKP